LRSIQPVLDLPLCIQLVLSPSLSQHSSLPINTHQHPSPPVTTRHHFHHYSHHHVSPLFSHLPQFGPILESDWSLHPFVTPPNLPILKRPDNLSEETFLKECWCDSDVPFWPYLEGEQEIRFSYSAWRVIHELQSVEERKVQLAQPKAQPKEQWKTQRRLSRECQQEVKRKVKRKVRFAVQPELQAEVAATPDPYGAECMDGAPPTVKHSKRNRFKRWLRRVRESLSGFR